MPNSQSGGPLDTLTFEKLLGDLDAEIQRAAKAKQEREQREAIERQRASLAKQLQYVRHQRTSLDDKFSKLKELNWTIPQQALAHHAQLKATEDKLDADLRALPTFPDNGSPKDEKENGKKEDAEAAPPLASALSPPQPKPLASPEPKPQESQLPPLSQEQKQDVIDLIPEMRATRLSSLTANERKFLFRVWALRWRVTVERVGQEYARIDTDLRTAFAIISDWRDNYRDEVGFIPALSPKHRDQHDWEKELKDAKTNLEEARSLESKRREAEELFEELKAVPTKYGPIPENRYGVGRLRKYARELAPILSMRDDLIEFCRPYKDVLGEDFAWMFSDEDEKQVEEEKKEITNREIASRILRRMISKTLIGGCHGPLDKIYKGLPAHAQDKGKEIIDIFARAGVLMLKRSDKGYRISIVPSFVKRIEEFVNGTPFGIKSVDDWVSKQ